MMHWTPGRLQATGYLLISVALTLLAVVMFARPRVGPAVVVVAVLLAIVGAVAIWRAQTSGGA